MIKTLIDEDRNGEAWPDNYLCERGSLENFFQLKYGWFAMLGQFQV